MKKEYLVNQPQQARSRETMNQILEAAVEILETKAFETLTISEVVQKAGTSVGAFYGRFKDKEGLLQALDERFFRQFEASFVRLAATPGWAGQPMRALIASAARLLLETYSRERGVIRSLQLKARLYGDSQFKEREQKAWNELFPRLQAALLAHRNEMAHPNPELATRLGFQEMFFSLRELLLWEPLRNVDPYDNEELVAETTQAYLAYLGVQD